MRGAFSRCFSPARWPVGRSVSLQRQAAIALGILACALLAKNGAGALIQNGADDAQARAQAAQLLEINEKQFAIGLLNQETGERGYELTGQSQYLQPYQLGSQQAAEARQFLDDASTDSLTRAKVVAMEAAASDWQSFANTRLAAVALSGPVNNPVTDLQGKNLFDAFRTAEANLSSSLNESVKNDLASAQSLAASGAAASVVGTLALLSLMGFLAVVVFRSTLHPIRQLVAAANALAAGEPVVIPSLSRSDEIGQLAKSLSAWEQASRERLELAQAVLHGPHGGRIGGLRGGGRDRRREPSSTTCCRSASGKPRRRSQPPRSSRRWTAVSPFSSPRVRTAGWTARRATSSRLNRRQRKSCARANP